MSKVMKKTIFLKKIPYAVMKFLRQNTTSEQPLTVPRTTLKLNKYTDAV